MELENESHIMKVHSSPVCGVNDFPKLRANTELWPFKQHSHFLLFNFFEVSFVLKLHGEFLKKYLRCKHCLVMCNLWNLFEEGNTFTIYFTFIGITQEQKNQVANFKR